MRITLALLCAWTVPILFLGPLPMIKGFELIGSLLMYGALIVAFLRMGKGIWFERWSAGLGKALLFLLTMGLAASISMAPVFRIGLLGAMYGN